MAKNSNSSAADELHRLRQRVAELEREVAAQQPLAGTPISSAEVGAMLLEHAPDVVALIDRDLRLRYINHPGPGYTREDLLGTRVRELLKEEDRDLMEGIAQRVLSTGESMSLEVQEPRQGRWYSIRLAAVPREKRVEAVVAICTDVTDRKQVEERLRASDAERRAIIQHAPDVIILIGRDARIQFINHLAEGYRREDVVGTIVYEHVAPEYRHLAQETVERVLRTGRPDYYEVQDVLARRWYTARLAPILDAERNVQSVVAICNDVHDIRLNRESLQRSLLELDRVFQALPDLFFRLDDHGVILDYKAGRVSDLYVPPEEFLNRSMADVLPPDVAEKFRQAFACIRGGAGQVSLEYQLKHRDGVRKTYEARFLPLQENEMIAVVRDISERKAAEEALTASEARARANAAQLDQIYQTAPVGLALMTTDDIRFLKINEQLAAMNGLSVEEHLGKTLRETLPTIADIQEPNFRRVVETGRPILNIELRTRSSQGPDRPWIRSVSLYPVKGASGKVQAVGAVVQDITELILAKEELQRNKEELERRVEERTQELSETNEQLKRERRVLERLLYLHERDRQLIAYEVHDGIVQDMAGAQLYIEAASGAMGAADPEVQENLGQARRLLRETIDEARRLINGLRPASLDEAGVISALSDLIAEMSQHSRVQIEFKPRVRFNRLAPALEVAIYRIVQEALNNVIRHSQSPRACVEIRQFGERVAIRIQDWGVGFDLTKVKKKRYGLIGVRERARLLGGRAEIISELGKGTTIDVDLPLTDVLLTERQAGIRGAANGDDDSSVWR